MGTGVSKFLAENCQIEGNLGFSDCKRIVITSAFGFKNPKRLKKHTVNVKKFFEMGKNKAY
jgi:hypothetical protein